MKHVCLLTQSHATVLFNLLYTLLNSDTYLVLTHTLHTYEREARTQVIPAQLYHAPARTVID